MAERPIFFDPTGRRKKRFRLGLLLFAALVLLSGPALAATIELEPAEPLLPVATERERPLAPPTASAAERGGKALSRTIKRLFNPAAHPRQSAQQLGALDACATRQLPSRRRVIIGGEDQRGDRWLA